MQRTLLETFHQNRVDVVVVEAYAPVTDNHARRLRGSTPRDDDGPMNRVDGHCCSLLAVAGTKAGESLLVSGNVPPPLGGNAPFDEACSLLPREKVILVMRLQTTVQLK